MSSDYHDCKNYAKTAAEYGDDELVRNLREYATDDGRYRKLLNREDHRAWRRTIIRELLHRGLIDADPGDAP